MQAMLDDYLDGEGAIMFRKALAHANGQDIMELTNTVQRIVRPYMQSHACMEHNRYCARIFEGSEVPIPESMHAPTYAACERTLNTECGLEAWICEFSLRKPTMDAFYGQFLSRFNIAGIGPEEFHDLVGVTMMRNCCCRRRA